MAHDHLTAWLTFWYILQKSDHLVVTLFLILITRWVVLDASLCNSLNSFFSIRVTEKCWKIGLRKTLMGWMSTVGCRYVAVYLSFWAMLHKPPGVGINKNAWSIDGLKAFRRAGKDDPHIKCTRTASKSLLSTLDVPSFAFGAVITACVIAAIQCSYLSRTWKNTYVHSYF